MKGLTRRIDFSKHILSIACTNTNLSRQALTYFHLGTLPADWNALMRLISAQSLDISRSSIHTKRRIWQESITTLLLTDTECHIPEKQSMSFSQARDSEYPPFLLDFAGTPGERHVENLKVSFSSNNKSIFESIQK